MAIFLVAHSNDVFVAATEWVVATSLGSVATGLGVLVVASLGFAMLFGYLDWRAGLRAVLGLFIMFAAPVIARELAAFARSGPVAESKQMVAGQIPLQPSVFKNVPLADPYAGHE